MSIKSRGPSFHAAFRRHVMKVNQTYQICFHLPDLVITCNYKVALAHVLPCLCINESQAGRLQLP